VARTVKEAKELVGAGFKFVTCFEDVNSLEKASSRLDVIAEFLI